MRLGYTMAAENNEAQKGNVVYPVKAVEGRCTPSRWREFPRPQLTRRVLPVPDLKRFVTSKARWD
jgi:hypothetical protein